jgi:hypothetical protein
MADKSKARRMTPEAVEMLLRMHSDGVSQVGIAKRLGFSETAIRHQLQKSCISKSTVKGDSEGGASVKTGLENRPVPPSELSISPNSAPQDYQNELSQALKVLSVQGLRELEPPRNWSEMKILNDMIRKADGLDARDKGGPVSLLVNVGASLSRRGGVVVEAVEVPETVEDWLV